MYKTTQLFVKYLIFVADVDYTREIYATRSVGWLLVGLGSDTYGGPLLRSASPNT